MQLEIHVASRLRARRIMLGMSQQQLATLLNVSLPQFNKYERALSRISSGRLYEIAEILDVPIDFFFHGLGERSDAEDPPRQRIFLEVMRSFAMIHNQRHQEALSQVVRLLVEKHD